MNSAPLTMGIGGQAGLVKAREGLKAWLTEAGAENGVRDDIVLACWEATANAIEHPVAESEQVDVQLQAAQRGDHIVVCVSDTGQWRERELENVREGRGLGLKLMQALMDRVEIITTPRGTQVFMCRRIAPGW
jgi:serine/threonine-protein kinase RsbW